MPSLDGSDGRTASVLCLPLGSCSRAAQFVLTSAAVVVFFVVYGYFQELIFRLEGFRPYGWYLTLTQFAFYMLFGLVERQISSSTRDERQRRIPWPTYLLLASLTVATMGLSNTAVGYLNYPTAVIFKCCKLIPVLMGGILIQGKRYGVLDVLASSCMTVGLIFFTLADSEVSPNFNAYGVIVISLALCADAAIGNVQERAMKQYQESNANVVLYSYSIGFLYILIGTAVSGQLYSAYEFCKQYPIETYGYAAVFSATGYIGVHVVLTQVRLFGALIAVTVTACRKALSIVLSFLLFTKPFTITYLWSGLIVLLGIYLNIYSSNKDAIDASLYRLVNRLKSNKAATIVRYRKAYEDHVV